MGKFSEKKHFVGVDISKNTLDLSLVSQEKYGSFKDKQIANALTSYEKIKRWLKKVKVRKEEVMFCMEHTGTYGLLFFAWLSQEGYDYCVEPGLQIKRSLGMTRGKNDRIDARRISDYAYTHKEKLKPFVMPSRLILQIKQLLTYRDQLVKIRRSLKNSIKSHEQYQPLTGLKGVTDELKNEIEKYGKKIKEAEIHIVKLLEEAPEIKKNFDLSRSVKGIGLVLASYMIVTTLNYTAFENGRQYASYAGIAPFEYTSGISIKGKTRTSYLGNKKMKALLSNGANSAIRNDPEHRAYYHRKKEEGKDHKVIINAVSCKLVNRVFAVIKRQTPYVITFGHNFS
jgi:transposase